MRANFTQLYVHCVWATWDRLPLITPDIQELIYASIIGQCHRLGGTVMEFTLEQGEGRVSKLLIFPQSAQADFVFVAANSIHPVLDLANSKYHC